MSSARHCWTTCSAGAATACSSPSPSGTTLPSTVAPWLPPVIRIFSGATRRSRERQFAQPRDFLAHRIADESPSCSMRGFSRSTLS
jgi:hypothetical protein